MTDSLFSAAVSASKKGVVLRIKATPGASRTRIVGMLGDRIKIAVNAPPQDGKGNRAVCKLLAKLLDVPLRDVTVASGPNQRTKGVEVVGLGRDEALRRLGEALV